MNDVYLRVTMYQINERTSIRYIPTDQRTPPDLSLYLIRLRYGFRETVPYIIMNKII